MDDEYGDSLLNPDQTFNIILLNWNDHQDTTDCLDTVLENTNYNDYRITVVDNGSQHGSVQPVKQYADRYEHVELVRKVENHGFAYGCNTAIQHQPATHHILLNNDTTVPEGWLKKAEEQITSLPTGIYGLKLVNPDGTVQHTGHTVTDTEIRNHTEDINQPVQRHAVQGAAFVIPHEIVRVIGYLDTWYYPIYREETDYCLRARRCGYPVYALPSPEITHTQDEKAEADSKFYQTRINELRFATLNHGPVAWLKRIPMEAKFFAAFLLNHRGRRSIFKQVYKEWLLELPGLLSERVRRFRTESYVPHSEVPRALQ